MATVTPGKTFTSNEVVTPANLNQLGTPTVVVADNEVTTAKIADGAVTQAKLNSGIILVPTGAIMPFAMNTVPTGWLAANGNEYSKTGTYAALFAVDRLGFVIVSMLLAESLLADSLLADLLFLQLMFCLELSVMDNVFVENFHMWVFLLSFVS